MTDDGCISILQLIDYLKVMYSALASSVVHILNSQEKKYEYIGKEPFSGPLLISHSYFLSSKYIYLYLESELQVTEHFLSAEP